MDSTILWCPCRVAATPRRTSKEPSCLRYRGWDTTFRSNCTGRSQTPLPATLRAREADRQGPRRTLFPDAEGWLFRAEGNGPFSLQSICDALEIDTRWLRRGVLDWRDRELAGEPSRMIRRPPGLPVKQASGSVSSRKKQGIDSAQDCREIRPA